MSYAHSSDSPLTDSMRREILRACGEAERTTFTPTVIDGNAVISSALLRRMLAIVDQCELVADDCGGPARLIPLGISRAEWHDKAWSLFHAKTFEDTALHKVNIHTIRAVFDATYDALPT